MARKAELDRELEYVAPSFLVHHATPLPSLKLHVTRQDPFSLDRHMASQAMAVNEAFM